MLELARSEPGRNLALGLIAGGLSRFGGVPGGYVRERVGEELGGGVGLRDGSGHLTTASGLELTNFHDRDAMDLVCRAEDRYATVLAGSVHSC
ncbi:hypothetical protein M1P56_09680 [Streptomyces sp. HU2014]|uniref:hypothetical protein n=1 Tax=Streptomyces sp. HU2014 TaxID=2939414 RepID=UPI00200E47C5|nr:hypothetical protein [Streptomyces sp. HU2014]UQI44596.1 hypothetical protein M1P56_09680 [Streptomyces sp. HU2014]